MRSEERAVAIVGVGAVLPDALNAPVFWSNILAKKYSISEIPPGRWRPEDYFDPDPKAPDKTYSKIGGWVTGFEFDWRQFRVPPKVAAAMDAGQQWAVSIAAEVLADYGYPERSLDTETTAVILGTAMGGDSSYDSHIRIAFPEYANALAEVDEISQLPGEVRQAIREQWRARISERIPEITEDTMPGELPNIVSGRVANMLNLRGPNFITDAACASSFAAVKAAMELLNNHEVDAAIAGGVDHNMGVSPFVKFCKIGALSATGSRPFGEGADGFVMGEGAAAFLLKRLEDAERQGDKIYAVIRGVGGSSDGKGKGITAPNPIGQQLAIQRAWENAGLDPATATLVEAHGTSTRVGDIVEVESLNKVFGGASPGSIGLGSAKSNIGHLKAGAGAAGLLKAVYALYHKVLPPTLNAEQPNPAIDFAQTPFYLLHEAREWAPNNGTPRRCGVSAYGFGGTNFHIVLEEYVPGLLAQKRTQAASVASSRSTLTGVVQKGEAMPRPFRGILALGAATPKALHDKLEAITARVAGGWLPDQGALPKTVDIRAPERLVIDFGDHAELLDRLEKARKVASFDNPQAWQAMEAQGIFRGSGHPQGKIAFLFPGQGSQYVNMGREFMELSPVVAQMFDEADAIMTPILGRPLTSYIFADSEDTAAMSQAQLDLLQTEITQPAMLALDIAMLKLLAEYGFKPDMVMGHSLGEYAALIAAGVMPFADALEAVAARGSEMARVNVEDNGRMAAVLAPYDVIVKTLAEVDGYVVPANINSASQSVIGGASSAVAEASRRFEEMGYRAIQIPVSHAFHTSIVAPASAPLRQVLDRLDIREASLPVVANVTGDFYPQTVYEIKDVLQTQVASPVQWVKGLETLYEAGARMFVEVGPKRALRGFVRDVFRAQDEVQALMTNHPKTGALPAFNQALCGLYAAGYLGRLEEQEAMKETAVAATPSQARDISAAPAPGAFDAQALETLVMQAVQKALGQTPQPNGQPAAAYDRSLPPRGSVVISGTGLGLPGAEKTVMDPDNALRILHGEQFIDLIPERFRKLMVDKRITRLMKGADGAGSFYTITDTDEVIKLAGRPGRFDLEEEYGVPAALIEALDITTQLAMAAGLDALREAGIPLVQTYRRTTTGKFLPDRWLLPEALRDETGVIFASAFPGGDQFAREFARYYAWHNQTNHLETLEDLRRYTQDPRTMAELDRRIEMLRERMAADPYTFDRRFLFRILSMGHSQFAQYIGARGPNTHVNAACASTAQGIAIAEDWIRNGRCRRVVVIGADAVTGDALMEWVGAGFLSVGAVTTKDRVEEAALPFDKRRHGTILGMGACALVVESEDALRERGMRGIVELLSSETSNSAFHGTRLDVSHISQIMRNLLETAETRFDLNRQAMAPQTVFMSHETFTPARGGSAAAEIVALRENFGHAASDIIIANTKGFTGHPMGVGIEDVIAVKILEHGLVPPVPNFKEVDPDLGPLNLSRGGRYPVQYAIHLAAGFGSQIAMTLTRRIPGELDRVDDRETYQGWLAALSGYDEPRTEVEKRVLRVAEQGAPLKPATSSLWRYGTGPTQRAQAPAMNGSPPHYPAQPAPAAVAEPPIAAPVPEQKPIAEEVPPAGVEISPEPARDHVREQVIALVAAQTGYPADMLDLDLDLEADLGIDTVKQAETFLAIREAYDIPQQANVSLRDYNTLEKVIGFVKQMRPDLNQAGGSTALTPEESATRVEQPQEAALATAGLVHEQVLALVAEQTGYPQEMLELDLDLEADLGIDTVKQAETFLAIREAFDIPQQENVSLRDYNTLDKVIGFVYAMRPDLVATAVPAPTVPASVSAPAATDRVREQVLALVAEQTGYPQEMLELDLDLEADLGIDTVKQAETFLAIREAFDIPQQENVSLRDYNTLEKVIGFVYAMRPNLAATSLPTPDALPPAPEARARTANEDAIQAQVLALVAEQTGYPQEMLELDLDLEADLGIDTVKQAETFLAIRETFGIPQQENVSLRDYNTLAKVVGFVQAMRPDLVQRDAVPAPAPPATAVTPIAYTLADADKMPRRIPVPALRPLRDLCLPTGVTLDERSRVVLMPDQGGVGEALGGRLAKLGATVLQLDPGANQDELAAQLEAWLAEGPVQGVYWLPALDVEPDLHAMDLAGWRAANRLRVKGLYTVMRALYEQIATEGTFMVTATRLGGLHGYGRDGATAPLGGAVTGFAKAYGVEQRLRGDGQGPLVKAVDFGISRKTAALADQLIAETLLDPGVVEVGIQGERRSTITLIEQSAADGQPGLTLDENTVFLVTGAAGGITSAIIADLAAHSHGIFYLLDLVPEPDPADELIRLYRAGRESLKKHLIDEAQAAGQRPTPAAIEKQIMVTERNEAALRAIEAVEAAGGRVVYRAVDLLDSAAVSAVVDEIRGRDGRIDVFIHAAGLLIDRTLPNKEPGQFDLVFDVKADGFFNILSATADLPLGATVAFSSVAGRFGNNGQSDYSAANDLLCKLTSYLRRERPQTKALAIDWTAWGDIGMAARGSVPTIMKALGIDMLPPESGVPTVRRELVAGGYRGEVLVAGALGMMAGELHETGGLDPQEGTAWLAENLPRQAMIGTLNAAPLYGGLQISTRLDPATQPFLYDHAPDPDTPWLPGVMAIESMAEAARAAAPGYRVHAVENVEMLGAFKFFRSEPRPLYVDVTAVPTGEADITAYVQIRSVTPPLRDDMPAREHMHFRAEVQLTQEAPPEAPVIAFSPPPAESLPTTAEALYEQFFHGPAYQVLARVGVNGEQATGLFAHDLPPSTTPADAALLMAPRLVEMCFQAAAQWHVETSGAMAFPLGLDALTVYAQEDEAQDRDLYALLTTADGGERFTAQVVDETGRVFVDLRGYRTVARPSVEE